MAKPAESLTTMDVPGFVVKMLSITYFFGAIVSDNSGRLLLRLLIPATIGLSLVGCDAIQQQLGLEDPAAKAARTEADGKAVGGACRQSGRAIEDCYSIYSWLPKSSIYEGWRDMDAYMRENKLETVEPQLPPVAAPGTKKKTVATDETKDSKAAKNTASETKSPSSEKQ